VDPETKKLLEETHSLTVENNRMLKSLHSSMRTRRIMSIIYWVFIIGSAIGAWYFIQPYVDQIANAYGGAKSNLDSIGEFFKSFNK
jgi:hypothetical protein